MVFVSEDLGTMSAGDSDGMDKSGVLKALKVKSYPRILKRAGLTGGSAPEDSAIEIRVGDTVLAKLYNNATSLSDYSKDLVEVNALIPAKNELIVECVDSFPAACKIHLEIVPKITYRRRYSGGQTQQGSTSRRYGIPITKSRFG